MFFYTKRFRGGWKFRLKSWCRVAIAAILVSITLIACQVSKNTTTLVTQSSESREELNIWWDKGFLLEEDEALQKLIANWEQQSGVKVKLSLQTPNDLLEKVQRIIDSNNLPDLVYSDLASSALFPRFAWEGQLVDLSDVIEPVKSLYSAGALEAVNLYNNQEKKRSYYAVPIQQSTIHIFYWKDLLKQAGITDIPKEWYSFWKVWGSAQQALNKSSDPNVYGLGLTLSEGSADTNFLFEQILEAHNVRLVDESGKLQLDDPNVRQGLIQVLEWYARFYQAGLIPPEAIKWLSPDNNTNLLNRSVIMTPNATLSIPASQRKNSEVYLKTLGTTDFPNKPDGQPMRYLVAVRQAVVLKGSKHQQSAKDFLNYLAKPETLSGYLKNSGGRYFPVMEPLWQDPFWTSSQDPHISNAAQVFLKHKTRAFYTAANPAYSQVQEDNVWGKILTRLVSEGIKPSQAADEAIAMIKEIFAQWK